MFHKTIAVACITLLIASCAATKDTPWVASVCKTNFPESIRYGKISTINTTNFSREGSKSAEVAFGSLGVLPALAYALYDNAKNKDVAYYLYDIAMADGSTIELVGSENEFEVGHCVALDCMSEISESKQCK